MASSRHVPVGEDPGPFNSDPPTSGPHYDAPLEAGQEWSELFKDTIPYAAETAMEIDTRYQLGYPQHSSLE